MKRIIIMAMLLAYCNVGIAQIGLFLDAFLPDSPYFKGHHDNPNTNHQLDTLFWHVWLDLPYPAGHVLAFDRYDFSYLPNGNIHQILHFRSSNGIDWGQNYRYTYEYNEQNKLITYRIDCRSYGEWHWLSIYDFTYDDNNRVFLKQLTSYVGPGYEDSHTEYRYEYDDEGNLMSKTCYFSDIDFYFDRWLYNYEDGKLKNKCYQRNYDETGWLNIDLYHYTYLEDEVSEVLYQRWDMNNEVWYNYENTIFENDNSSEATIATLQTWLGEWINKSRSIKHQSENGTLIQEQCQEWQNEEWVDKRHCDYTIDSYGNCEEGCWKDLVSGEWIESQDNYNINISYNDGESMLSEFVQSYQARYSHQVSGFNESSSPKTEAFPNPGTNQLTIQTNCPFTDVFVYDLMGRIVFHQTMSETTIRISTDSWPSGIYFWKAFNSSSALTGKWIKQ